MIRNIFRILMLIVFALMVTVVSAQGGPGGGGPGGAGGPADIIEEIIEGIVASITLGEDWSTFELSDEIPTSEAGIMALLASSGELDTENMDFSSVDFGDVSPEVYAAIAGFSQTYLGANGTELIFAGDITDEMVAEIEGATSEVSGEASSLPIDMILEQLPEEVQTMLLLANVSGTGYWGVMPDGAAIVYTNLTCSGDNCNVSMENVQIHITSGSLGAFARYDQTAVTSSAEARNLIISMYPAMAGKNLEEQTSSSGYAFIATGATSSSSVEAYYAGVIAAGELSIVYVVGGVGQGYVDMMR